MRVSPVQVRLCPLVRFPQHHTRYKPPLNPRDYGGFVFLAGTRWGGGDETINVSRRPSSSLTTSRNPPADSADEKLLVVRPRLLAEHCAYSRRSLLTVIGRSSLIFGVRRRRALLQETGSVPPTASCQGCRGGADVRHKRKGIVTCEVDADHPRAAAQRFVGRGVLRRAGQRRVVLLSVKATAERPG